MNIHRLFIVALAVSITGCAEKEQATPAQEDESQVAVESVAAELPTTEKATMGSEAFIRHMHHHASHLAGLNAALADEDLEAAKTPAHWLLRHEEVTGHPDDWQPHIDTMRDGARAVADAPDIGTARTAAQRITEGCQGCHAAAAVDVDLASFNLE